MAEPADIIAALVARVADLEERVAELEELTGCKRHASNNSMAKHEVAQAARIALSKGQSSDDLVLVASDAGFTLRELAQRVGCSGPLLTQARRGVRSISKELAERVQAATRSAKHPEGFAPTKANWPALRG